MNKFWEEMLVGAECVRLVEQLLIEEEKKLKWSEDHGKPTHFIKYRIARMKYALGHIHIKPTYKDFEEQDDE